MTIPLHRQLAAVRDEISKRRRLYPKWVDAGRMTESEAADRIDCMVAVLGRRAHDRVRGRRPHRLHGRGARTPGA